MPIFSLFLSNIAADSNTYEKNCRLWRVTPPTVPGKPPTPASYILGSMHLNDQELINGTPELNFIFNFLTKRFFFEVPDKEQNFDQVFAELKTMLATEISVDKQESLDKAGRRLAIESPGVFNTFYRAAYKIIDCYYTIAKQDNPYTEEEVRKTNFIYIFTIVFRFVLPSFLPKTMSSSSITFDYELFKAAKLLSASNPEILALNVESFSQCLTPIDSLIEDANADKIYEHLSQLFRDLHDTTALFIKPLRSILNEIIYRTYELNLFPHMTTTSLEEKSFYNMNKRERNSAMLAKFKPYFDQEGSGLLVTGLEHCRGHDGFINSLKKSGYKIEKVHETPRIDLLSILSKTLITGYLCKMLYNDESHMGSIKENINQLSPAALYGVGFMAVLNIAYDLTCIYTKLGTAPAGKKLSWLGRAMQLYTADAKPIFKRGITPGFIQKSAASEKLVELVSTTHPKQTSTQALKFFPT